MANGKGMGGHESPRSVSCDWITPRYIIESLGEFDLDPCASVTQPWACAKKSYTLEDDGLRQPWKGRIWLNPPYNQGMKLFLAKLGQHGNGIALLFARTDTRVFHSYVWPVANAVYFLKGRIRFHRPDGTTVRHGRGGQGGGAPSVLIAYGDANSSALKNCELDGAYLRIPNP